jgi:hypothetical protein
MHWTFFCWLCGIGPCKLKLLYGLNRERPLEEPTTVVVQRFLNELADEASRTQVVQKLLTRAGKKRGTHLFN